MYDSTGAELVDPATPTADGVLSAQTDVLGFGDCAGFLVCAIPPSILNGTEARFLLALRSEWA